MKKQAILTLAMALGLAVMIPSAYAAYCDYQEACNAQAQAQVCIPVGGCGGGGCGMGAAQIQR